MNGDSMTSAIALFDDFERTDMAYKHERETDFLFLNRCALPAFAQVRAFLEQELTAYPAANRSELIHRLRRGSEANYNAAIFELQLYGALSRLGYHLEPHPDLPSGRAPDFLVTTPLGDTFYLEATLATEGFEGRNESADKRKNVVLDDLDKDIHPDFALMTSSFGNPTTQPSSKKLRRCVQTWLASLDYDEVAAQVQVSGHHGYPTLVWRHEDWTLTMRAHPVAPEQRGATEHLVWARSGGSGWVDRKGPLRDALDHKSNHYGDLDLPLVVAVNVTSIFLNRFDEVQTLYGDHVRLARVEDDQGLVTGPLGGFWHDGGQPRRRQLSGAWVFRGLNLYNTAVAVDTLYLHPWADKPVPAQLGDFATACLTGDYVQWVIGRRLGSCLGSMNNFFERAKSPP